MTIELKPPFLGLNTTDPPETIGPQYATIASNILLKERGLVTDGDYEEKENLSTKVSNPGLVLFIYDLADIFEDNQFLVVMNNKSIVNIIGGAYNDIVNNTALTQNDLSTATFINQNGFVFIFTPNAAALLRKDGATYEIVDFNLPQPEYQTGSAQITAIAPYPQPLPPWYDYEWKCVLINDAKFPGSRMNPEVTELALSRLAGTPGSIIEGEFQVELDETIPFLNSDSDDEIRIYRRRKTKYEDLDGDGVADRITENFETVFYFCPTISVVKGAPSGGKRIWTITDSTRDDDRDFSQPYPEFALIEGGDDAIVHTDKRIYLINGDKVQYTYPDEPLLEDEFIVDQPGEELTGITSFFSNLILQKKHKTFMMAGFPPNQIIQRVSNLRGGFFKPYNEDDNIYIFGRHEFVLFNGSKPVTISQLIKNNIRDHIFDAGILRFARDYDNGTIYIVSSAGGIYTFVWHGGAWTESLPSFQYIRYNITISGRKELLLSGVFGRLILREPGVSFLSSRWQTGLLSNGSSTHDKHWLNIELEHETTELNLIVEIFDKIKTVICTYSFTNVTDQFFFRLGARGRYIRLRFDFKGVISRAVINANTLASRS